MHTIREITRLATMLAGLIGPQLRLGIDLQEHCRLSRNNPHCAPRHVIYYCILTNKDIVSMVIEVVIIILQETITIIFQITIF